MAGKISEYANAVATFADGDLVDVSKRLSTSPDVFESQKLEFAQFQAFIQANASNILNTNGLTLGGMYSHDLNSNYLTFTNGTLNISQGSLLVQAETNLGSTAVLFKKQNGDTMFNFLDNGNVIVGGNSTVDLGSNILTFDGDLILNSNVNAPNLPTASTGLSAGDFWNENGVVRVGTSGIGPSSIYTADGILTGDRTVSSNGNDLTFDSSSSYIAEPFKFESYPFGGTGTNPYLKIKGYGEVEILGRLTDLFTVKNGSGSTIFDVNNGNAGLNGTFTVNSTYFKVETTTKAMNFYQNGGTNLLHDIQTGIGFPDKVRFNILSLGRQFIVGGSAVLGTETISLQGSTVIKGIGTAGSSALAIYDNDTTPNKLWDFLDNGDLNGNNSKTTLIAQNLTPNDLTQFVFSLKAQNGNDLMTVANDGYFQFGLSNVITGGADYSECFQVGKGNSITSNGSNKINVGIGNSISGAAKSNQINLGSSNTIQGGDNVSIGAGNTSSSKTHQVVLGRDNTVDAGYSNTIGFDNDIVGLFSSAIGVRNKTTSSFSYLFGSGLSSTASGASIIGYGDGGDLNNKLVNNTVDSLALGWNTTTPQHLFKTDGVNLTLPTASTGLSSGDLWNDGGTVKIV